MHQISDQSYQYISALYLTLRVSLILLIITMFSACTSTPSTNGSGYQFVRFTSPAAAKAASQDETAGPAISSNNKQCRQDKGCLK